jgi:hypothetical protein
MSPDIDKVLAFEIKQEIASRYFGFRKLIEEDTVSLKQQIREHSFILEKRITFDLLRIYLLLKSEVLIKLFLIRIGLDSDTYYDPSLHHSAVLRDRIFSGLQTNGWTRKRRFHNLLETCYENLHFHAEQYRKGFSELIEEQDVIKEEIALFYKKNELGSILTFFQSLGDANACCGLEGGMEPGLSSTLEQKMRIEAPLPIEQSLPLLPPLPQLNAIQGGLRQWVHEAYKLHSKDDLLLFTHCSGMICWPWSNQERRKSS